MPESHYERLSALDASFLDIEEPNARWHEGAIMVFDRGPLVDEDGSVDVSRISQAYESCLHRVERYRQRLATIPWFDHPIWVDDPSFNIRYHIRHISLPRPGDERILKRVCGYLLSQPLDLSKPLWEVWVVDGLASGGFALCTKIHHCMVDGASGMSVLASLLRTNEADHAEEIPEWTPRPAPSGTELVADEIAHRVSAPFDLMKPLARPREALETARQVAGGLLEAARLGWRTASDTLFNPESIGPHRRFDWTATPLDAVKEVKNRLGGTVNDVVLSTAAGALGQFLRAHHAETHGLDFRALVPVSVRSETETRRMGNRVAMMMTELPIGETDPHRRLEQVVERTRALKQSNQALGVQWIEEFADRIGGRFFLSAARSATQSRPFNVAITNVPGPQFPLYLLGCRMRGLYPMMPLFSNQALGIAVVSYDGQVFWGFNSDWDSLPDLHDLVDEIGVQFEQLMKTAVETSAD